MEGGEEAEVERGDSDAGRVHAVVPLDIPLAIYRVMGSQIRADAHRSDRARRRLASARAPSPPLPSSLRSISSPRPAPPAVAALPPLASPPFASSFPSRHSPFGAIGRTPRLGVSASETVAEAASGLRIRLPPRRGAVAARAPERAGARGRARGRGRGLKYSGARRALRFARPALEAFAPVCVRSGVVRIGNGSSGAGRGGARRLPAAARSRS